MQKKKPTGRRPNRRALSLLGSLGLLLAAASAHASDTYLPIWASHYTASASDNTASCALCHTSSTRLLNPYGKAFCDQGGTTDERIAAIEGFDSDADPTHSNNLTEITASAQPGWTTTPVPTYNRGDCSATGNFESAPFTGLLDPEALVEVCDNGVDDNDNGLVDCEDPACDGFTGDVTTCGVGACASEGNLVCSTPDEVDTCTPGNPTSESLAADTCNDGIDNDCDGLTDTADPDCAAPDEICDNGIDDDFDGNVDCADLDCENFVYGTTSCGIGACAAEGQEVCQSPDIVDTCTPGSPSSESLAAGTCDDGIDNDCDGLTDTADPDCSAPDEICDNGIDDDFDGNIDCADLDCDGFMDGACSTGLPGICAAGTLVCQDGGQVCVQNQTAGTEGPFGDATCEDGLDNDCDGQIDDSDSGCAPVPEPEICDDGIDNDLDGAADCSDPDCDGFVGGACDTGNLGVCATGTTVCRDLQEFCDQNQTAGTEGPFDSATCSDGLDNDCDGLTDANDPDCDVPPEVCDNGTDDNGDGLIDCEDPQCDGTTYGACDTGAEGVCSAGTLTCDGTAVAPVCLQDQAAGVEGTDATCNDGLDNDCDGLTDTADPDCQVELCDNGTDDDSDGLADCADPDCDGFIDGACDTGEPGICAAGTFVCQDGGQVCVQDQTAGTEGPYGSLTCSDGLDNDCDGLTDADDPDCAAPVADVYLSKLQTPKKLNGKAGQVVSRKATAKGDGTLLTQDATVTLTGIATPGLGVVVEPASVTAVVVPGNPQTSFGFSVSVTCQAAGTGSVDWTATISAPGNDDSTNDVLTGTTSVTCR